MTNEMIGAVVVFCAAMVLIYMYLLWLGIMKTLRFQHKKTLEYIFETAKAGSKAVPPAQPTKTQLDPVKKKRKGRAYLPSKDPEVILEGGDGDDWDKE